MLLAEKSKQNLLVIGYEALMELIERKTGRESLKVAVIERSRNDLITLAFNNTEINQSVINRKKENLHWMLIRIHFTVVYIRRGWKRNRNE